MQHKIPPGFAVWITGLPASGKSTLARSLERELANQDVNAAILESDVLRPIFTPHPNYSQQERDSFYTQMAYVGALLVRHGVSVVFDATANLHVYRDGARQQIARFVEVYLDCPLEICVARDPKGIYRSALQGSVVNVPGLQATYERPENPDITVRAQEKPETAAQRVLECLRRKRYLPGQ